MVKSQHVGPIQIVLATLSAAIGATIVGTAAAAGNLRLNSPSLVLGILFLGPPAIALTIKLTTWLLALIRKSAKVAELHTIKLHDSVAAWTTHTAHVQQLRRSYRALKADLAQLRHRDVCALYALRTLPQELRRVVLELVRGADYAQELREMEAAVSAARLAWQASKRAMGEGKGDAQKAEGKQAGMKRLGGVQELPV